MHPLLKKILDPPLRLVVEEAEHGLSECGAREEKR